MELTKLEHDLQISMSNALTRAGHSLTLSEKRLVMLCMGKLDSTKPELLDQIYKSKVTASDYANQWNVSLDTAYDQLKSASKSLHDRKIIFFDPAHKRTGKKADYTVMNWVGQVDYHGGEGWVELHWWPTLMRHLVGLKKQFTSYRLEQATALRSVSSWRLLELLSRFKDTGWAQYTIEDFADAMDATEKQKQDFAAIRRKIIEPAISELTLKNNWEIEWKPIKEGRKVVAIRFDFRLTGKKAE
jgi:plasmid replication initiation protein